MTKLTSAQLLSAIAYPDTLARLLRDNGYSGLADFDRAIEECEARENAIPDDYVTQLHQEVSWEFKRNYSPDFIAGLSRFFNMTTGKPLSRRHNGRWQPFYEITDELEKLWHHVREFHWRESDNNDIAAYGHDAAYELAAGIVAGIVADKAGKKAAKNMPAPAPAPAPAEESRDTSAIIINGCIATSEPASHGAKGKFTATIVQASTISVSIGALPTEHVSAKPVTWPNGKTGYKYAGKTVTGHATRTRAGMWYVQLWTK